MISGNFGPGTSLAAAVFANCMVFCFSFMLMFYRLFYKLTLLEELLACSSFLISSHSCDAVIWSNFVSSPTRVAKYPVRTSGTFAPRLRTNLLKTYCRHFSL